MTSLDPQRLYCLNLPGPTPGLETGGDEGQRLRTVETGVLWGGPKPPWRSASTPSRPSALCVDSVSGSGGTVVWTVGGWRVLDQCQLRLGGVTGGTSPGVSEDGGWVGRSGGGAWGVVVPEAAPTGRRGGQCDVPAAVVRPSSLCVASLGPPDVPEKSLDFRSSEGRPPMAPTPSGASLESWRCSRTNKDPAITGLSRVR